MNRRGLLGAVVIVIIVLVVLIASGYVYFAFIKGGVELSTGKVTVNLQYNASEDQIMPDKNTENNETNKTKTEENNNIESIIIEEVD